MSTPEAQYQQKRMMAADAVALIRDGDTVVVPTGVGEPPALLQALSDRRHTLRDVAVSQIHHVNIVTHAGAIFRRIIIAENSQ